MFRKKQIKILRVKDGKKRLSNANHRWSEGELTYDSEVVSFLEEEFGLHSVQILGGQTVNFLNNKSYNEFCDYFRRSEIVDILIPSNANLDEWTLRQSAYDV